MRTNNNEFELIRSENETPLNRRMNINKVKYFVFGFCLASILAVASLAISSAICLRNEDITSAENSLKLCEKIIVEEKNEKKIVEEKCEKKVVGFYRLNEVGELTGRQLSKYTHVIFTSFVYCEKDLKIKFNSSAIEPENFKPMKERSKKIGKLVRMFSLRFLNPFMISNYKNLIIQNITSFIETHELDGINIEWPDPQNGSDWNNFIEFCESLKLDLNRLAESTARTRPYVISLQCPIGKPILDFYRLLKTVDFINMDVSHYYVPWWQDSGRNHLTGPASPLYSGHPNLTERNVHDTMRHYSCITKKPNRLVMIFSFGGRYWTNVIPPKDPKDTLWMVAEKKDGNVFGNWETYKKMKSKGFRYNISTAKWNDQTKTHYIWDEENRIHYHIEDERSLLEKVKYAIKYNIGGIGTYSTSYDDDNGTLLNVLANGGLCPHKNSTAVKYNCVLQ